MTEEKTAPASYSRRKVVLSGLIFLIILLLFSAGRYLNWIYGPNISTTGKEAYLFIRTGADFKEVTDSLKKHGWVKNISSFEWVAHKKHYTGHVKAGRYLLTNGMNNKNLVNILRSGAQSPLNLIFNNIRNKQQLAGRIGRQLEADSTRLLQLLNDPVFTKKMGFTQENILCLFIPNTYEFYWNTSPEKFISRMDQEFEAFWNKERKAKAKAIGLNPVKAGILASIIEMESTRNDEKPTIAGVYLNRLKRGIPLEADPTLIYALGDYSIRRVLKKDLELESPYNTYKHTGLPPGPITLPSVATLQAVISPAHHDYLYFCAKSDLSGYHLFSKTLAQHMAYARDYQAALNHLNIKR